MSAGTQTLTMPRKGLFLPGIKKKTWPNPQNSIDFSCGRLGGIPCWTAKGDAQSLFEEIEDGIKELLDSHMDDIAMCQTSREAVGWSMYMMGRDISHAKPVFVFDCLDPMTRAKVVSIVKKSKLWKHTVELNPALGLASHARGPQACGFGANIADMPDNSAEVYSDETHNDLCGAQIYVHVSQDSSLRVATLGGIIRVGEVLHGITVAHVFDLEYVPQSQNYLDDDDEFVFEDDMEMEDESSSDFTREGSESPNGSESNLGTENNTEDNLMKIEPGFEGSSIDLNRTSPVVEGSNVELNSSMSLSTKNYLGSVEARSKQYPDDALDWAIIPIGEEYPNLINSVRLPTGHGKDLVDIIEIAGSESASGEVWAITASNGSVKGRLSTVPYYLKMTGFKTFQKTWTTSLEADVAFGASGTWIIDFKTHKLLGQLVARRPGTGLAYVISASHIREDIEFRLKCKVALPVAKDVTVVKTSHGLSSSFENPRQSIRKFSEEAGCDDDANDISAPMILHQAAEKGHEAMARQLLEKGASIEARNSDIFRRKTALHLAAEAGQEGVIQVLLINGADLEAKTKEFDEKTALHLAAEAGYEGVLQLLLERGADIAAKTNYYEQTALHLAAEAGHEDVIRLLLEKGADIVAKTNYYKQTALHLAAEAGHEDVIRLLLEKGADTAAKTSLKEETALHLAAKAGHEGVIQTLIDKGADLEAKLEHSKTALHLAAKAGHEDVIRLLLEKGADIEAMTYFGKKTALHLAAYGGYENLVQLLLEHGANIEAKDRYLQTALCLAAGRRRKDVVLKLLEMGADMNNIPEGIKKAVINIAHEKEQEAAIKKRAETTANPKGKGILNSEDDSSDPKLLRDQQNLARTSSSLEGQNE